MQSAQTKTSAGLILTDGKVILGCIPFGRQDALDIPKGLIEENETPEQAVIREVKEEIGIDFSGEKLIYKGKFLQYKGKYLHIYVIEKDKLPELKSLYCNSTFYHQKLKKDVQEHVGFKYILIEEIQKSFYKSLIPILQEVCSFVKQKEMQSKKIKNDQKNIIVKNYEESKEENNDLDDLLKKLKKKEQVEKDQC